MNQIPYKSHLKDRARYLRNNSTLSEIILWRYLKKKQRLNLDFNRQKPIGNYIVDFYNSKNRLAIEIDGSSHENKVSYDLHRDQELKSFGIRILHLDDRIIKRSLSDVIDYIDSWIIKQIQFQTPPSDTSDDPSSKEGNIT